MIVDRRYLDIWIRPRSTLREIINGNVREKVAALVIVAALIGAARYALSGPPLAFALAGHPVGAIAPHTWHIIAAATVVSAAPLSLLFLYFEGAMLRWSGSLLGGSGDSAAVRAAIGWSRIPVIAGGTIYLALLALGLCPPPVLGRNGAWWIYSASIRGWPGLLFAVFACWQLVIFVAGIGEVHGFSGWRAAGAALLALFAVIGAGVAILFIALIAGTGYYAA